MDDYARSQDRSRARRARAASRRRRRAAALAALSIVAVLALAAVGGTGAEDAPGIASNDPVGATGPTPLAAAEPSTRDGGRAGPVTAILARLPYGRMVATSAARYRVDPLLVVAVVWQESHFDPSSSSTAGAVGLMQLMPETAEALGVDPSVPAENVDGGVRYLRSQLDAQGGDVGRALAAYNAGPGAVARHGGIPPYDETREYVRRIEAHYAHLRAGVGSPTVVGPVVLEEAEVRRPERLAGARLP